MEKKTLGGICLRFRYVNKVKLLTYIFPQILCGTDPFPTDFRAKKYKLDKHWIVKVIMINTAQEQYRIFLLNLYLCRRTLSTL